MSTKHLQPGFGSGPFDPDDDHERVLLELLLDFSSRLSGLISRDEVLDRVVEAVEGLGIAERVFVLLNQNDHIEIVREPQPRNDRLVTAIAERLQ